MSDTKVYLLDGGTLVIDGFHAFWNRGPGGEIRFPTYSVLIEHVDGRYIFDTGYDYDHVQRVLPFEKPLQTAEQTIPGQLAKLNLKPSDIDYVINSHYHFDHCGGNKHLSEACTLCHAKELEACGCPQPFEGLGYSDMTFAPEIAKARGMELPAEPALDIYTPKFETLAGDQEIAKSLWLFETPGHTAGHYSLMVELGGRKPMLFTADACYSQKNMDMMCISSFHLDPVASVKSMQRLKDLAEQYDAELFYSHDPESYPDYLLSPGFCRGGIDDQLAPAECDVNYSARQQLGARLRREGSLGIAYDSVRRAGGACVAVFQPIALAHSRADRHLCYLWGGAQISLVYEKRRLRE